MNGPSASDAASQAASRPRRSTARRINYDEGPDEDLQMSPALELTTSAPKEPAASTAEAPSAPAPAAVLTAHLPAVKSGAAKASSKKGKKTKAEDQEYTEDAAAQKTGTAGSKAGRAASKKAAAQPDALPAPTEEQNNLPLSLLERLPFPAWDSILPHLQRDPVSMMRLSLTCRTIYGVVFRNEKVWKERCLATGRQKRVSRHDTWRETYWKLWSSRCINCSQPSGAKMKTPENESIIPGAPPHLVQCTDCQGKKGPYQVISKGRALAAGASKDFLDELPAKFLHNGYGSYGVSNWITQYLRSSIPECVDHTIPKWRSGPNIERCLALFGHADGRAELERILKMASSSTKVAQPTELQTFAREIVETQQTPTETLQEFIDYYSSLRTMLRKVDAALVKAKAPPEAVALLSLSDVAPNNLTDGASWIELLVEGEPVTTVKAYVKDLEKRGAAIIKQREEEAARVAEAARQAAIREEQRLAARAKADADRKARDEKLLADRLAREAALDQLNAERIARGEDAVHQPGSGGCHSGIACSNASARECANGMCGPCCASRARPCSRHVNRAFVAQQSNQATVVQEVQQVEEMPSPQAMQIDNQTLPTIPSQPQQQRDGDEAPLQPALPPFILSQQDAKASGADGSVSASLSLPDNTFDSGFVLPEGAIDAGSSLPGPSRLLARLETETMSSMYGAKRPADALADSTGARSGPSTPSKRARTDETILAPLSNGALIDNSIETTQEQHF